MTIELRNETMISLSQAARMLPPGRRGRPVSLSCILRWIIDGVRTPAGVIRLEAVRMGGRWLTTVEALERFAERQTPNFDQDAGQKPRPEGKRRRASERAERELERAGI